MSLIDIEIQASERNDIDCDNYEEMNALLAKGDFIETRCGEIFMSRCKILIFRCCECKENFSSYEEFFNHLCEQHASSDYEIKSEPKDEEHLLDIEYCDEENLIVVMNESEDDVKPIIETPNSPKTQTVTEEKDVLPLEELSEDYDVLTRDSDDGELSMEILQHYYEDFEILDGVAVDSSAADKSQTFINDFSKFVNKDYPKIEESILERSDSTEFMQPLEPEKENNLAMDSLKDDVFGCRHCSKVFDTKQKLLTHTKHHNKMRRFKCHICGFAFKEQFNLRSHLKRHNGAKIYECEQCDKKFVTRTELNAHIRTHTGERPYVCEICGNCYITSGSLNEHRKRHNNHRPHKCTFCDKSFFDTGLLKEHIVVHTGERTHSCNVCQTAFTRRKALLQHMKLHSGVKQYKCMFCEKAFAQKPGLASHLKTHRKVDYISAEGQGAFKYSQSYPPT